MPPWREAVAPGALVHRQSLQVRCAGQQIDALLAKRGFLWRPDERCQSGRLIDRLRTLRQRIQVAATSQVVQARTEAKLSATARRVADNLTDDLAFKRGPPHGEEGMFWGLPGFR